MAKVKQTDQGDKGTVDDRVFIFPTLQMNVVNYREDEQTLLELLKMFGKDDGLSKIKLATGYFNLQEEFLDVIKANPGIKAEFLTSSPRANGFYKAGRFKKYIPGMYRVNELAVLKQT